MNKASISDKQGVAIISLFITGSSSIFAQGLEAKQDLWLSFILAILLVLPMVFIFARLHNIFPCKDLFDIIEICFGKLVGKIIIILYIWYVYFFASDIFSTYGEFINLVGLPDTPKIVVKISIGILCIFGVKKGIQVLGRFSEFFIMVPIVSLVIIIMLLRPSMQINNLQPVLSGGIKPVLQGTFSVFTFPLVQLVVFTMAFSHFNVNKSSYKVYIIGLLIGATYLAILSTTNVLVLGVNRVTDYYFSSHETAARISVGGIIQRMEVVIDITFILGGFIKISILLICACKGISKIFGIKDYRSIITPVTLLTITLSHFQYDSVMYLFEFARQIWPYYNFPFQVILPIIIWVTAENKRKILSKQCK
ncbi:GerAB/ArcD/ProY family transporter [Clostridium grantii]|uniref:Spore germination protein KB n=1 Tax=Clostridium grantii DSM 8605 TaxID=1121316 RepID=A0A1M5WY04_9CLOT|nr:endospore germination permease [Clostridium grantii]SHH91783.1 spore germination protein KB [Clostridium grantii DSM 8605]